MARSIACALAATALAALVLLGVLNGIAISRGEEAFGVVGFAFLALAVLAPVCVGLFLVLQRPRTLVAWILLAGGFSVVLVMAAFGLSVVTLEDDPDSALGAWALLLSQEWLVLFAWPLALAYVYLDGQLPSPRWKPMAALAVASCGGAMLLLLGQESLEGPYGDVPNPFGGFEYGPLVALFWACWVGVLISLFGGALALRARYKAGDRERHSGPSHARWTLGSRRPATLVSPRFPPCPRLPRLSRQKPCD